MKSFQAQTFYELLEVSVGAGESDIRAAFERLARLYAEDQVALYGLIDEGRARALRSRLKEAADTLLDADRRATYDAGLGLPPREVPKRPAPAPAMAPRASAPAGWAGSYAFVSPTVAVSAPVATSFSYTIAAPVTAPARPSAPVAPKAVEVAAPVAEPKLEAPKPEVRVEVVQPVVAPAIVSTPVEPTAIVAAAPAGAPRPPESAPPVAAAPSEPAAVVAAAPAMAPPAPESAPPIVPAPSEPAAPPVAARVEAIAAVPSEPPSPVSGPPGEPAVPPVPARPEPITAAPAAVTEPPAPVVPAAPERPAEPAVSPPSHAVAPPAEPPPVVSVAPSAEPIAPPAPPEPEEVRAAPPGDDDSAGSAIVPTRPYAPREYRPPERSRPYEVPAGVEFNGDLLRQVRMARGLSLLQVAERTRIGVRHLENLENDRYEQLPVAVYLRGMLMSLARELGLDGIRVSKSYLTFVEAHHSKSKG